MKEGLSNREFDLEVLRDYIEPMQVMIVEDEGIISLAAGQMVERLGHQVFARVASAEEALARLEIQRPDLVLMDIHLQGPMDGIEACSAIRKRWKIPIAYTSAYSDPETRRRAAATDAVDFLAKPVNLAAFRGLFSSLSKGHR